MWITQKAISDKHYKKHLFQTKKKILRDKLNSGNNKTKTLYKITKSLTSDTNENTLLTAISPKELTDTSANFFVDKVTKIRSKFQDNENYQIPTRNCKTLLNFQTITEEELIKTIKTMKSTTSSNDLCNTEFILNFAQILAPVWTNIINKSIEEGTVLKCWKEAIVLSVQKNHNLGTDLTNYWQINHLTFFSKLIEKIILNNSGTILKQIIYYQSAYRANHSTEAAILNLCDNILQNMEKNINTAMVALDLSAAFDTVNHRMLLEVLNKYCGIRGLALQWLKLYLTDRQFKVQIEENFSEVKTINFSVPQGSILGPVLFTYYASSLQELFINNNSLSRYADDHSFIKSFSPIDNSILTELELDIKNISEWMYRNHLKMNDAKIEFITYGSQTGL